MKRYKVLYMDPPWLYHGGYHSKNIKIKPPYPMMSSEELASLTKDQMYYETFKDMETYDFIGYLIEFHFIFHKRKCFLYNTFVVPIEWGCNKSIPSIYVEQK